MRYILIFPGIRKFCVDYCLPNVNLKVANFVLFTIYLHMPLINRILRNFESILSFRSFDSNVTEVIIQQII